MYNFKHCPAIPQHKRQYHKDAIKLHKNLLHIAKSVYVPGNTHVELHVDETNRLAALRFTNEPTDNYPLTLRQSWIAVHSASLIQKLKELGYKQFEPIYPENRGDLLILPKD